MLECGKNFGGTLGGTCGECENYDDEDHRLNYSRKWKNINFYETNDKIALKTIYSVNVDTLRNIISLIEAVWNTRNTYGIMNI